MTGKVGTAVLDSSGNIMVEECDLGTYNTKTTTDTAVACNADCQITDKNLWNCYWVADKDSSNNILGYHS